MRLGVLHARIRQDEKLILAELDRRGVGYELIHVEKLVFDLHARPADERWLGFDVVLERCVSHSRAMAALRILDAWGIPCVNPWWIGEVCGDKLTTNLVLAAAGVPVPRARVAFTPESALEAIEELGYPAVLKPAVGSWGRLLARVTDRDSAEAVLEHKATLGTYHHSIFYIQEHVAKCGYDIRSFVIGDETVCAVERHSDHWITNTARGAVTRGREVDEALHEISLAAARAVGGGVVAVDLFETDAGLIVNEVNYTMEFKNSIDPTGVNIPAKLVDYLIEVGEGRVVVPAPPQVARRSEAVT